MLYVAAGILSLISLTAVLLVIFQLPGIWVLLLSMIALDLWQPTLLPLWAMVVVGLLALSGEIVDFAAGAAGSKAAGGSRRAGVGAIIGGIVGAIAGTPLIPIPVVGTIVGGAAGAGLGAALFELSKTIHPPEVLPEDYVPDRPGRRATKVAVGAATGRLVATVIKLALSVMAAVVAVTGMLVNWL
ncbi:MAG: DUF456 domain-containing protein [Phycisphaerales bacterium]|nr:DUF456 domain-containing protein [Phycisphaerales bacterium]